MNKLQKQVLLELVSTPDTVVLMTVGVSLLVFGWSVSSGLLVAGGVAGLLGGIATLLTHLILKKPALIEKAQEKLELAARQERDQILDDLDTRLLEDRDPRDQKYLRDLRSLYDDLIDDLKDGKVTASPEVLEQVRVLFDACVASLEYSYRLWTTSVSSKGEVRTKIREKREQVFQEVEQSVLAMHEIVTGIRELSLETDSGNLAKLRTDLTQSLKLARRTNEFLGELDGAERLRRLNEEYGSS